jgi:hypothetical protein
MTVVVKSRAEVRNCVSRLKIHEQFEANGSDLRAISERTFFFFIEKLKAHTFVSRVVFK